MVKRWASNGIIRSIITLVGGTAGAQLISMVFAPLLTRLYSPEDYGVVTVFVSLLGFVTPIAALRFEQAIPLPTEDQDAVGLLIVGMVNILAFVTLSIFMILFLGDWLTSALNIEQMRSYLWFFPIGILSSSAYLVLYYLALRKRQFKLITQTKFSQSIYSVIIQVVCGFLNLRSLGLILAQIVASAGGVFNLLMVGIPEIIQWIRERQKKHLMTLFLQYRRFALLSTPSAVLNNASMLLPPVMLSAFYGPAISGQFGLALKIIFMPMGLIGYATGNALFSHASEIYRERPHELGTLVKNVIKKLCLLGFLIIMLGVSSIFLFPVIFGSNWKEAGIISCLLSFTAATQFVAVPLAFIPILVDRLDIQMIFDFTRIILTVLALSIPANLGFSGLYSIGFYSLVNAAIYLCVIIVYIKLTAKFNPIKT